MKASRGRQRALADEIARAWSVFSMDANRILEIYNDFAKARLDRLGEVLDEKIDFISHAPTDVFPYLGRRRGREEVLRAFAQVHRHLEVLSFWPITTVVDQDQAALTVVINIKERASGKVASFLAAHFLRFRNDCIVDYRAIIDSLDVVRQISAKTGSPMLLQAGGDADDRSKVRSDLD